MKKSIALLGALLLFACGGEPVVGVPDNPINPTDICISSTCGETFAIADIPDAENLLITDSGRIFVSGGTNVFELGIEGVNYKALALYLGSCNFTGLAVVHETLYAACGDGGLFAGRLNTLQPELIRIHELDGMGLPNGMTDGPDNCLYITDGPLSTTSLPTPQIVRVCPNPSAPLEILSQEVWLDLLPDAPNGITRIGNTLYITDTTLVGVQGRVRRITMDDSFRPVEIETIYNTTSILDDLSSYGSSLLVTDYLAGNLFQISLQGEILQEGVVSTHASPSSVLVVGPPLFRVGDVLLTEKGMLGDTETDFGNKLVLLKRAFP